MAARPRIKKRANWPANLHEPREGYYTYRDPRSGKVHVLGRIPLAQAIFEAHEANAAIVKQPKPLTDRIEESTQTVADILAKMPTDDLKASTLKGLRSIDKRIRAELGHMKCASLKTTHISDLLEKVKGEGKARWALAIRSRLNAVCTKGVALGWMEGKQVTNSEMLRLAAKAAGISLEDRAWNPLRDDGDCFRLMVTLGIEVKRYQRDSFHLYVSHPEIESAVVAAAGKDALEGMRLAVVQVAVKLYHHRNDCRIEPSID